MDFSGSAGAASPFDEIPVNQLAFAVISVRGVKASAAGGAYLDCELTIDQGQPYAGRKLWDMIGDPNNAGNSEKYRQMGSIAITRILETGRGAGPNNPAGYQINSYADLDGLRVAIKIGIEPGTNGHADKNRVAEYLTPNPASKSGHKGYAMLVAGQFNTVAPAAQPANGFGGAAAPAAAPAVAGFGAPQPAAAAPATAFGNAPAAAAAPSGFGTNAPGFPGAQQSGPVATAANPSTSASATPSAPAATSPSNQPGATPGWLSQAAPQPVGE